MTLSITIRNHSRKVQREEELFYEGLEKYICYVNKGHKIIGESKMYL